MQKKIGTMGIGRMKSAMAIMMAAGLMAPQTTVNPANGQTIQQQLINDSISTSNPYKRRNRKGLIKSNGRIGRAFIVHNQRQKRKRWRQVPQRKFKRT